MLVLARRLNESVRIGDDIEIVVVEIRGDQVKLGIRAPKNVKVYRNEIYREIQDENIQAAKSTDGLSNLDKLDQMIQKKKKK